MHDPRSAAPPIVANGAAPGAADYRSDFTLTIARRDLKRFAAAGIEPASWKDKKIRVRGWLSLLNGPEIELTHPEQVEVISRD